MIHFILGFIFLFSLNSFAAVQVGSGAGNLLRAGSVGSMAYQSVASYSPIIQVKYTATATTVSNSVTTQIDVDTSVYAKNSSIDGSGNFTPPRTGRYLACYKVGFALSTYVIGNYVYAFIEADGVIVSQTPAFVLTNTTGIPLPSVSTCDPVILTAGTLVKLYAANNRTAGTTAIDTTGYNTYVSYTYLGD